MLLAYWQYGCIFMAVGLTAGQFSGAKDSCRPAVLQSGFNSSRQGHYWFAALASLSCFADQLIHWVWPFAHQGAVTAGNRFICEALNKIYFLFFCSFGRSSVLTYQHVFLPSVCVYPWIRASQKLEKGKIILAHLIYLGGQLQDGPLLYIFQS